MSDFEVAGPICLDGKDCVKGQKLSLRKVGPFLGDLRAHLKVLTPAASLALKKLDEATAAKKEAQAKFWASVPKPVGEDEEEGAPPVAAIATAPTKPTV